MAPSNATPKEVLPSIEWQVFPEPSGDVRGFVVAFISSPKGRTRIAHAHLLTNKPASVSVKLAKNLAIDELEQVLDILAAYAAKVRELDKH